MKCPVDIEKIYNDYIQLKYEENHKERYKGKGEYYHASSSGSCSRKNYFSSVEQLEHSNEVDARSNRIMRLGTVLHDDLQEALLTIYSNTTDSNTVYSKEKEIPYFQKEILNDRFDFHIEKEVILEDLNVRGFYDLVAVSQHDGKVYLIDFKTMGSYPWSRKFGRKYVDPNPSEKYPLQLATYGLGIQQEFGRIDGMFLYYYNKDTSRMKTEEVPMHYLAKARNYWTNINREHKKGLPMFSEGLSPVEGWECNYCSFLDHCKPPFFNKK